MFNNIKDFYPTPKSIINKMLSSIDFKLINSVLEPSAGKGDIVNEIIEKLKYAHSYYYNKSAVWDIDTIEINENLQHILKGKGYRIVHNEAINFITKNKKAIKLDPEFEIADTKNIEEEYFKKEITAEVAICLDKIPLKYSEVLSLYYLEEKSYDEISDILRLPIGTVGTRINRGKLIIKKICKKLK